MSVEAAFLSRETGPPSRRQVAGGKDFPVK